MNLSVGIYSPTFQFEFSFKLPNSRKERLIIERDGKGRIITSQTPPITL